jgi:hypothetical protein
MRVRASILACIALAIGLASCSSEGPEGAAATRDGALRGTLGIYIADRDDGSAETRYVLLSGDDERTLLFDREPDLPPGASLQVWGDVTPAGLRVSSFEVLTPAVGTARQELIGATPLPERSFAFVLVDIGGGVNLTATEAQRRLFGTAAGDNSVKQYYDEVSYGTQPIGGSVFGPIRHTMSGCDTRGVVSALRSQIPGTFQHYLWYFGSRNSSCSWSGLAETGTPESPNNDTWYNASAGCVVLVQEPGHNFGMAHSSSMACGSAPFADNPESACTHSEYGDRYDPMGGGCDHMNVWQKTYQGWLQKCNAVRANSTATFTLLPVELACNGIQALQIPMPKVRPFTRSGGGGSETTENLGYYYLELRTKRGFDADMAVAPTVLVHVAEDFRNRTQRARHTWILDMDPSTRTINGLNAGQSFTDPAGGVSFAVQAVSAESATIQVTINGGTGAATCLDGSTLAPPGPSTCTSGNGGGTGGSGGTGGAAGSGGAAGTGGAAGSGGSGGSAGSGGTGGMPPAGPEVLNLTLMDADADTAIGPIIDGESLNVTTLPANLSLRADTNPATIGSVSFDLDGQRVRTESRVPYSLTSDDNGDFYPWDLALGTHTVTAIPFSAANASGTQGDPLTVTFTLIDGTEPGTGGAGGSGGSATGGTSGDTAGTGGAGTSGAGTAGSAGTTGSPVAGSGGITGVGGAEQSAGTGGTGTPGAAPSSAEAGELVGSCGCRMHDNGQSPSRALSVILAALAAAALRRRRT